MGKHRKYNVTKYVSYDADTNISTCLECGRIMSGLVTANIRRHYAKLHSKYLDRIDNSIEPSTSATQKRILRQRDNNNIAIKMDRSEFIMYCVGLVTVKDVPFTIFDDEQFFKKLMLPFEEKFNINVNSKNIVGNVNEVSNKIVQIISTSVHNKMICLKLDVASRMDKSILSINVQYIKDFEICVNTIGVIQLKKNHTEQFLKDEIFNCIKKFNIDVTQVYSITSDNGVYMLKTLNSLQELQEDAQKYINMDIDAETSDEFEEIHCRLAAVLSIEKCLSLTIQSAAHDVLKTIPLCIEECRKAIKTLQGIIHDSESNITIPIIDNSVNWNSTFEMILSLSKLREFVNNGDIQSRVPNIDWNFIAEFIEAFQPLSECTKKFQSEQYIIGDFYRDWLCCEIELEELIEKNAYAPMLSEALKQRKESLLSDDIFISAIYLDPRFNFLNSPFFTEDEKRTAVVSLFFL